VTRLESVKAEACRRQLGTFATGSSVLLVGEYPREKGAADGGLKLAY